MCQSALCTRLVLYIRTEVCNPVSVALWHWSGWVIEEALEADPIRLLRETTGISRQIFWYNTQPRSIYICINIRISQWHFILFTVQKLTVFHKDFNNELGKRLCNYLGLCGTFSVQRPLSVVRLVVAAMLRIAFLRAEARCLLSPDAIHMVPGPHPGGPLFIAAHAFPHRVLSAASWPM